MHSIPVILLIVFSALLIQAESGNVPGAPIDPQLNEERRTQLIDYAIETYNERTNCAYVYKVVGVDSITIQVLNGVTYNLKLEIGETDCLKRIVGKECNLKTPDGSKNLKCEFNIHEQSWLNHRTVSFEVCTPK